MYRLVGLTQGQAMSILVSMKAIATGDGTTDFGGPLAQTVRGATTHLLHIEADADELPTKLTSAELAELRGSPAAARAAIDCALLIPLTDSGRSAVVRMRRVMTLADELGIDDEVVKNTYALLVRQDENAARDLQRRVLVFKTSDPSIAIAEFERAAHEATAPPRQLEAMRALARAPEGTLGWELARYYSSTGFLPPGEKGAMPWFIAQHDFHHVLGAYDTSPRGEIYVNGFTCGISERPALDYLAFMLLQFHHCVKLSPLTPTAVDFDPDTYLTALDRGAQCRIDVADPSFDFIDRLELDLSEVRAGLGITGSGTVGADGRYDPSAHPN